MFQGIIITMKQFEEYKYDNKVYKVEITRKRMKNIRYRLVEDTFKISAPNLASKRSIYSGLDKFAGKLISKKKPLSRGDDFIYLFGYRYMFPEAGELHLVNGQKFKFSSRDDFDKKIRKVFLSIVTSRVRYFENLMQLKPHNVRVRIMNTRYGSNSKATRTVTFALKLYSYSLDILDAIVVHELAHSIHFDHSPAFYSVVYKYCPNYVVLHKKLQKGVFL